MNSTAQEKFSEQVDQKRWLQIAFWLSMVTIFYNALEGIISTYFGLQDDTLALFGFGIDSFVEVLSGIGIAHMIYRMQNSSEVKRDQFEKQALQLTGFCFYFLAVGMILTSGLTIWAGEQPTTTLVGIIVALASIGSMYFLVKYKLRAGQKLNSQPIIADANCTKTCLYLSVLLLISSGLYELFRIPYIDAIGALGISWFAFKEGREAFDKAKGKECGDCC
ncbi:cation transporter [Tunicatimonas pelagia]|uniref:cation transporter n=1 Tax=Tunicatimonas pelagia TaxID=931531 RepID=UPI00266577BB|nr:cation transporter [Tunicatimonas pelagia]WKN41752.1 cation transporter [Tunicatimonas pelagia]